jgi:uroporphyrinogen decarboxylase
MTDKKSNMTDKERVEALLRREKPDRVPIWPFTYGFPMVYTGTSIADAYNKPEVSLAAQKKAAQDFGWIFTPFIGYAAAGGWEFGGEIKWPTGELDQAPMLIRHPVETVHDVWNLKMPDVKNSGIVPNQLEFFKLQLQEELDNKPWKVVAFIDPGPFTLAGNLCSSENLNRWIIKEPEAVHHLLRLSTDYTIERMQYWKDVFGTDRVVPWSAEPSASNQLISPKTFEKFAFPYIKEVNEKTLAMGFKTTFWHICGEQNANLQYWAQIPMGDPAVLSFGHEVDLEKAAEYFPNDIIVGNLEPAIIQTGTPEQVYEASRKVIEQGKKLPTGFMFAPGCDLPPRAPVDNVMAMTRAANDFGWYE